jgi:glycosyltransferase involved in cell wall biosynthesis
MNVLLPYTLPYEVVNTVPKILAYVHAYHGHGRNAGAESTLHDMLRFLVREGWQADVLLSQKVPGVKGKGYTIDGVNVIAHSSKRDVDTLMPNYDVAITHLECSPRATAVAAAHNVPIVHLVHNSFWQTEGYLAKGCDFAVYNTDWIKDHHEAAKTKPLTKSLGDDNKHVVFKVRACSEWPSMVLHPLVNPADYRTDTTREYVTLVNLYENKGPDKFYYLAKQFPAQKFLAVKGGYGEQVIEKLPNVTFMENTKDIREVYAKTKVVLMPSTYESYGRIAVEAAASGIPSLVTPTKGLLEALDYAGNFAALDEDYRWRNTLAKLIDDADFYEDARWVAEKRSAELWERSELELKEFLSQMESLATR